MVNSVWYRVRLPKLRYVRGLLDEHGAENVPIEVDGGVCPGNVASLVEAGADAQKVVEALSDK